MLIGAGILVGIGVLLWFISGRQQRTSEEMSKTKAVPIGQLVAGAQQEAQGTVVCAQPLQTPFSKQACVYYSYDVEREVRSQDQQGRLTTRWEQVDSSTSSVPFQITDSSGAVTVNPQGATVEGRDMGDQWIQASDLGSFGIVRAAMAIGTSGNLRAREKALLVGGNAYVFGAVNQGSQGLEFQKGGASYVISYKTEAEVEKSTARSATLMKVLSVLAGVGGIALAAYSFMK